MSTLQAGHKYIVLDAPGGQRLGYAVENPAILRARLAAAGVNVSTDAVDGNGLAEYWTVAKGRRRSR